jgi:cyclic pyranopterin phosphate synthase
MTKPKLTHIDEKGAARMVDVSEKDVTSRAAVAEGRISMRPETLDLIVSGTAKKGDVMAAARLAGIMAAKRTHELIPLCHPLPLSSVAVELEPEPKTASLRVTATAKVTGRTGVEMEALTAVSLACLTVYDMVKAADKTMRIGDIRLIEKSGGRSGKFKADK